MVNTPLRPRSSSLRLRFISVVNLFILSLSWRVGRNNGRSLLKHSGRMILLKRMLNLVQFWDNQKKNHKYPKLVVTRMSPESRRQYMGSCPHTWPSSHAGGTGRAFSLRCRPQSSSPSSLARTRHPLHLQTLAVEARKPS